MRTRTVVAVASMLVTAHALAQPTWEERADSIIRQEVDRGFSGSVLLVHDGQVVLNKGYGFADREHQIPNTPDTLFALGSTPIDFTHAAILQLLDQGKIALDDPISKYFTGFTGDHARITIDQLRTGRSGLPDFPNDPAIDADPDHSPLSRDAFIERTRNASLLFAPGTDRQHSHFAWGVLAAVVEVASGQPYPQYIKEHVLQPAGMTRTGFNGEPFPDETIAIGYDARTFGDTNSPPHWGPTSWLVMGSGGMLGTTGDLFRFDRAIHDGTLIPKGVLHLYPPDAVYSNGNMFGFETVYNFGGDDLFYVNCNDSNTADGYTLDPFCRQLEQLCSDQPLPRFSIGIAFGLDNGDNLIAAKVIEGKPAAEAGLEEGDVLLDANGQRFDPDDPLDALRSSIEQGTTLRLRIRRDGKKMTIVIHPTPIED